MVMTEKGTVMIDKAQAEPQRSAGAVQDKDPGLVARIFARFAVATGPEVDAAILMALEEISGAAGVEHAYVLLLDPGGESYSMGNEWCAPGIPSQQDARQHIPTARCPWLAQSLRTGHSVQIDSLAGFPPQALADREFNAAYGTRSLLMLPLRGRDGQNKAALVLRTISREHRWTADEVRTARVIGDVLVSVLDRKQMEQSLRESEAQLLAVTQLSPDIISIIDASGKLIFNSPAAKRIHGYDEQDLVGTNTTNKYHPEDEPAMMAAFHRVMATPGSIEKVQYRYLNKDGSYVWMEAVATNQLHHPVIQGIVCLSRDISDRKREEEERRRLDLKMQQLQKLESLSVLAGGVAHDFNNLLVAILGNIDLALARLPADSPAREGLGNALKASHRAADLAKQMLAYAGKGHTVLDSVDLGELVAEMARMLNASIAQRATLRIQRESPLPSVEVDPSQIRQVILNLILNATESIGAGGGTITITTRALHCTREDLAQTWLDDRLPAGEYVLLEVADTGCGMDHETVTRIFDPFFTTKFTGRGLGLAAALGIIRSHKGGLRVSSEPGRGTTFGILLPASAAPASTSAQATGAAPTLSAACHILVVDDEEQVRHVATGMLECFGFSVLQASNGTDALAILAQDNETPLQHRIQLVILDLTMPGMDGHETFARLRQIRGDLPVIITSGYVESDVMRQFEGTGRVSFMQKPFALEDFASLVQRALAASPT